MARIIVVVSYPAIMVLGFLHYAAFTGAGLSVTMAAYVSVLPPFEAWHGAVLPYPLLVAVQVVIILMLAWIAWRVRNDTISPRRWKYRMCFGLGGVYFGFMAFRLLAGLTFLADHAWLSKSLPAFFHVGLATFVLVLGQYIYKQATKAPSPAGPS